MHARTTARRCSPAKLWGSDWGHLAADASPFHPGDRVAGAGAEALARGRARSGPRTPGLQKRAEYRRPSRADDGANQHADDDSDVRGADRANRDSGSQRADRANRDSGSQRADGADRDSARPRVGPGRASTPRRAGRDSCSNRVAGRSRRSDGGTRAGQPRSEDRSRPLVRGVDPAGYARRMGSGSRTSALEIAALVALLRTGVLPQAMCAERMEESGSAIAVLEEQQGLLAPALIDQAAADVAEWTRHDIQLLTVLDPEYPQNLRTVHDRPPLLFVRGRLSSGDVRSIAVIGSRRATPAGLNRAQMICERLLDARY